MELTSLNIYFLKNGKDLIMIKSYKTIYFKSIAITACGFLFLNSIMAADAAQQTCASSDSLEVTINSNHILRQNVPTTLFGFTVDWYQFQNGHFRNGAVRPETIEWLKPFSGAVYRYSGGNAMEWKDAVGALANRKPIYANYAGMQQPLFGPTEFFNLMQQVNGKAVVLLNVLGPNNTKSDQTTMIKDNMDYLSWLSANGPHCVSGINCPITYFELGNELDWPPTKWNASDYSKRVSSFISTAKSQFPKVKFAVMGKTAPWSEPLDSAGNDFDASMADSIGREADAVTIHPYYDGYSIPTMQSYIEKLAKKYNAYNPNATVFITEHGRWPAIPKTGDWSVNWYQASGSGGALSTADFMLMLMTEDKVSGAMWHTISVTGPWQLFHLNNSNDSIYPSATYWSLRTLRSAFLTDVVEVTPALKSSSEYTGGYDTRLVAMTNKLGNISLMGVNRSTHTKAITVNISGAAITNTSAQINIMQSDSAGHDNSDSQPNRFIMNTSTTSGPITNPSVICIPPKSTFSILMGPPLQANNGRGLTTKQSRY
jgi:hypothetical protein